MSSQWCQLSRLLKTEWAEEGHKRGEHWSFAKLCEMVDQNQSGKNRMGVKTKPYWDFIPFENYVLPMLHLMIGVGNDIFSYFMDTIEKHIIKVSEKENRVRNATANIEEDINACRVALVAWDKGEDRRERQK